MVKRIAMILGGVILSCGMAFAQTSVTGKVTSSDDGEPVVGASIKIVGTNTGTVTDIDGNFVLNAPADAKLEISYIGMQPKTVKASAKMQVVLTSDNKSLDEVVVTGYGVQKKASFTGAASLLNGSQIEKKSDANFVKALEGNVSGIQMNNSTGQPGTWGSIYVRGRSSISSGTQPLYVIDGMPMNSDKEGAYSGEGNYLDPMASVNPEDIETVTVLKDAAATAIYGARAANGVIVITTKKGTEGKLNINVDIKQGFTSMANNNMDYANAEQTMNLYAQGRVAAGQYSNIADAKAFLTEYYKWDGKRSTNWIDEVTRHGYYQDYNISAQGKTGKTGFYISAGYLDTKGLVIASDFKRYSGRVNVESKFGRFAVGANANYAFSIKNGSSQSTAGAMSNTMTAAISMMQPFYPTHDEEGKYYGYTYGLYNPLALADKLGNVYESRNETLNLNPYVQVDIWNGIYFRTNLGVNIMNYREYEYMSAIYDPQGMGDYNGYGDQFNSRSTTITWNNVLGWNKTINDMHNVSVMLGQEMQKKSYYSDHYTGYDFPFASLGMNKLSTAGKWEDPKYEQREARLASYFADAHYSYLDKYYASASFRRDGSSVFGTDNLWGNFWSVGAKWRLSSETFLKDNPIITNATLRASYGTVGNQDIDWYAARGYYMAGHNYDGVVGIAPESISNTKLTWETSKKFDIGFDLSFINRIHLSLDYYNETTSDALMKMPLSMTTGLASTYKNIGKIRNQGIEVDLKATIMHSKDLDWNAYANMTWNQNRVVKLSSGEPIVNTLTINEVGYPYNEFYMREYAGVDKTNGKPLWYKNETGDETTSNYREAAKRHLGSADPKVFGGFGSSVNWKGLDASVSFNYRLGAKVYDYGAAFTGWGMREMTPLKDMALNSWTEDNPNAKYPRYVYNDPDNSTATSSRFLMNGSYLRLSNITLGYTLPSSLTKKAFMQKVRIYISADNLYTFTASDFTGYTPDTYDNGVIAWQYPGVTTFVGGIQITF
uniref:SusC/RagA family TonB-linked outer membrane protein n=1 Tax=Prevotella sp. TaxID=59823 RepID=UPI0040270AB6